MIRRTALRGLCSAPRMRSTTILAVRRDDEVVMIGDGQVTMGSTVAKSTTQKVRRIDDGKMLVGFAGAAADCLTMVSMLEDKVKAHPGQLRRACVELAKDWRTNKILRNLEAQLIVADDTLTLTVSGLGDVLEPEHGVVGIGSGGDYAVAAARALMGVEGMSSRVIATRSMEIAADLCIYTNHNFIIESITKSKQ